MKKQCLFILILLQSMAFAQKDSVPFFNKTLSKNNLSVELGGSALFYSVGYERRLFTSKKILLVGNMGVSYLPFFYIDRIVMPLGVNTLVGEKRNKLGIGCALTNLIDFTPYPKTKQERAIYKSSPQYQSDLYSPPFRLLYIVPSIGYCRFLKNGNSFSLEYNHIIYNEYGKFYFSYNGLGHWFRIKYNFMSF